MAPRTNSSKLRNAGAAAYWGYKAFQALRLCVGDISVITELISEGLGGELSLDTLVNAFDSVINLHGGLKKFRARITNFSLFSRVLSKQLLSCGDKKNSKTLETADRFYRMFMECDLDNSGGVSLEEYVVFCSKEGVPRSMAETMFFQADIDGNGQISFEEWTAMMKGRVGRDPNSFNCGGHHGLTLYTAPCNGLMCDFCKKPILAGSPAMGCRRCDCDACAECSGITQPPTPPPSSVHMEHPMAPGLSSTAACRLNCPGGHGLSPHTVAHVMQCDWCRRTVFPGNVAVGCRICNCDACMECVTAELARNCSSRLTCPQRHGMVLTRTSTPGYVCDFCGAHIGVGVPIFSCRICHVDACPTCVWTDHNKVTRSIGGFTCKCNRNLKTTHIMHYYQLETHRCSWCRGSPMLGERVLRCDICSVSVCNTCIANNPSTARADPAASAVVARPSSSRRPPPSYDEITSSVTKESPSPPPLPSRPGRPEGKKGRAPPCYEDMDEHAACPEVHRPTSTSVSCPFRMDSIVRVVGSVNENIDGKLMTVLGFEPDGKDDVGEEGGVMVMQRRGQVHRVSQRYVFAVVD